MLNFALLFCVKASLLNFLASVFVLQLMIYSRASLAETVCHLNHWDHYSIPIHALEVGLKQRQLDTVALFLKSRENGTVESSFGTKTKNFENLCCVL